MVTTLFITEKYAPSRGGACEMLSGRFAHAEPHSVMVLANGVGSTLEQEYDRGSRCTIVRRPIKWGRLKGYPWIGMVFALVRHGLPIVLTKKPLFVECARVFPEGVAALVLKLVTGCRYVVNAHGEDVSVFARYRIERLLMRFVLCRATLLLANSNNTKKVCISVAGKAIPCEIVHPGFAPPPENVRKATLPNALAHLNADDRILLTVGRLQERKGQAMVIRSLPAVLQRFPKVYYIIIGDEQGGTPGYRSRLESIAEEVGARDRVILTGDISLDELYSYYNCCDLFVMPNRTIDGDIEGYGIVFLEAGFFEKPVIGGNSGGVPDAVLQNETGLIVDGTSIDEISSAICRILDEPNYGRTLGLAGRSLALSRTHSNQYVKYRDALQRYRLLSKVC